MNVWERSLACALLLSASAFLLATQYGCRSDKSDAEKALPEFVMVAGSTQPSFDKAINKAIKINRDQNKTKYSVTFESPARDNPVDDQIKIVERLTSEKVRAILIIPADSKKIVPALKQAVEQGIVVVSIGDKLDEETLASNEVQIPRVGFDKIMGATELGNELANLKLASKEVAVFAGDSQEAGLIRQAFETSVQETGLKVVSSEEFKSASDQQKIKDAENKALGLFADHPSLGAILCADSALAEGAAKAVHQAQRKAKTAVLGMGNAKDAEGMLENDVTVAAIMYEDRIGVHAVELALLLTAGGSESTDVAVPVELEKGESYAEFAKESESLE